MSSLKTYTAADMERYHRGEMTTAEMHALEKAALDDPMLADALEGYLLTSTAAADLQSLQNKLQQRTKKEKQKTLFFISSQWLKIAAIFVLLMGAGWLVFRTFSYRGMNLASSGAEAVERQERNSATDSISTVLNQSPALFSDSLQQSDEIVVTGTISKPTTRPTTSATSAAPKAVMTDDTEEKKQEITAVEAGKNDPTAAPDNTALRSPVLADTIRQSDVAQQRAEMATDAGANRQMQTARARSVIPETAEPEGGWQAFEKYIAENKKPLQTAKQKNANAGDVELRFEVDKNGRPENIVVTKSLCQRCDEEAIRLLKEGPRWTGTNGKVKITLAP